MVLVCESVWPTLDVPVTAVMLPVGAAATGVLFLGESLSRLQLFAFALCLAGVLLATLPGRVTADASR